MKEYYTVSEASEKLGVHIRTVYRMIVSKAFPAYKLGNWRIKKTDLEKYIESRKYCG